MRLGLLSLLSWPLAVHGGQWLWVWGLGAHREDSRVMMGSGWLGKDLNR